MDIIEEYNRTLKSLEEGTIRDFNRVLDASFNRIVRRARQHIRLMRTLQVERHLQLLEEFRQLIPVTSPDQVSKYDVLIRSLIADAAGRGLIIARILSKHITGPRIDVSIPLDATAAALVNTRERLQRHGEDFAQQATRLVAQGITEGRPTSAMITDLSDALDIVKARAATIVRTESLRAYNSAADRYYSANSITQVMWYATADDRTCPFCAPRAGTIYNRGEVSVPLHPNCRCFLSPWSADLAQIDPRYRQLPIDHRQEVEQHSTVPPPPSILNKGAILTA